MQNWVNEKKTVHQFLHKVVYDLTPIKEYSLMHLRDHTGLMSHKCVKHNTTSPSAIFDDGFMVFFCHFGAL